MCSSWPVGGNGRCKAGCPFADETGWKRLEVAWAPPESLAGRRPQLPAPAAGQLALSRRRLLMRYPRSATWSVYSAGGRWHKLEARCKQTDGQSTQSRRRAAVDVSSRQCAAGHGGSQGHFSTGLPPGVLLYPSPLPFHLWPTVHLRMDRHTRTPGCSPRPCWRTGAVEITSQAPAQPSPSPAGAHSKGTDPCRRRAPSCRRRIGCVVVACATHWVEAWVGDHALMMMLLWVGLRQMRHSSWTLELAERGQSVFSDCRRSRMRTTTATATARGHPGPIKCWNRPSGDRTRHGTWNVPACRRLPTRSGSTDKGVLPARQSFTC